MVTLERTDMSCGAQIMHGLYGFDKRVLSKLIQPLYRNWYGRDPRNGQSDGKIYAGETIIFSDAIANKNGLRLEKLIKEYDLGRVVKLSTKNPNTGHQITTYLWCYNGNTFDPNKPGRAKKAATRPVATRRAV